MLSPTQSLLPLRAAWSGARRARKIQATGHDLASQPRHLARLRAAFARTAYGRDHGIETHMSDQAWRERVPLRLHQTLSPYLERMLRGEADVLWPGPCHYFSGSAGLTGDYAKCLPVTADLLAHFRRAGGDALFCHTARAGKHTVFGGKHLLLGGALALAPLRSTPASPVGIGDLGAFSPLHLPSWAAGTVAAPGEDIVRLDDWTAKIDATVRRCADADVRLLAGAPDRVLALADALLDHAARERGGKRPPHLRALWPRLECLVHGSMPLAPYATALRARCGVGVRFHEIYLASEAVIAAQDSEPEAGLRLLADTGVHFEFIPLADYDESRLSKLGPKALPLEGVKIGVDYALVLSTPAGLARYVLGDIVRFTSTTPARLHYVGRLNLLLNAFGESVLEKELTDALAAVCRRHGWQVVNFHVAPLFSEESLTGYQRGRHEWWIELLPGTVETPTGPVIAAELDQELQNLHSGYRDKRRAAQLPAPTVRLVMPGVFENWQREAGRWGGQHKSPRARSDRLVADAIARHAPFHDA
jgi:hypothetical protein